MFGYDIFIKLMTSYFSAKKEMIFINRTNDEGFI
jgi:hypothetical protein